MNFPAAKPATTSHLTTGFRYPEQAVLAISCNKRSFSKRFFAEFSN